MENYYSIKEKRLKDRFFKQKDIEAIIQDLPDTFKWYCLGNSAEGRRINAIQWGNGPTKIMLWSQMHGDEATGTMALFDLINYLKQDLASVKQLEQQCQLLLLPMVNPDGAERFTRRNAQLIDINRDYIAQQSPEARLLKKCRDDFAPHFGFNLHDQNTLWSVETSSKPASLSFLAPAFDQALNNNENRTAAMQVIAYIYQRLKVLLPDQIGLFDDEYEARAFGDNFQKAGTATILIEAGGYTNDTEKQQLRKFYFLSILYGLQAIAQKTYQKQAINNYTAIPKNNKQLFHLLIHGLCQNGLTLSLGINYSEKVNKKVNATQKIYWLEDLGDLSTYSAYQTLDAKGMQIKGELKLGEKANFELKKGNQIILAFKNGKLPQKH